MRGLALPSLDLTIRARNLHALSTAAPAIASRLARVRPPDNLQCVIARDGRPTYRWSDAAGRTGWLGRTTMPAVRANALADVFQPGAGNVAIVHAGQGELIRALLSRLSPLQAVFVVEPDATALDLVLTLHDFSQSIAEGRLCLFGGDTAWDDLEAHLLENAGYLVPDRIVSWPWFSPRDVADISDRLTRTAGAVTAHRRKQLDAARQAGPRHDADLLILAPESAGDGAAVAHGLCDAARRLGRSMAARIADRPSQRDAGLAARTILETRAARTILIDAARAQLPTPLPDNANLTTWLTYEAALTREWLAQMGRGDTLVVPYASWRAKAAANDIDASRVLCIPPGARPDASPRPDPPPAAVAARDVGLVLASHEALWNAAIACRDRKLSPWSDAQTDGLLREAESASGVRLTNDEVRDAIRARIRSVLGPGVEWNAYLSVWRECFAEDSGIAMLFLPVEGRVDSAMLDGAANGIPLFVRSHPGENADDGWPGFVDRASVNTFSTPAELRAALARFREQPADFSARAAAARQQVRRYHTWENRLAALLQ